MSADEENGTSSKSPAVIKGFADDKFQVSLVEPEKQGFFFTHFRITPWDMLAVFLAETIGTGLLVFLGCMGCVDGFHWKPTHLTIALSFGLAVMLIINIFGCVSGGQLNPVITLAAVIYKRVSIPSFFVISIAQLLGGYLGYALLRAVTPSEFFSDNKFCVSLPTVSASEGFVVEYIISTILILVFCGVIDPRNDKHHDSVPLRFGLAVTCLALVAGSYSGGSMNPARSFGPALYNGNWTNHWIYWAAPFSASIVTSVFYRYILYREPPKPTRLTQ